MTLRGVVWDLDDTLMLERDYVRSGFQAVADQLGAAAGVAPQKPFELLWSDFLRGVRGDAFDRALAAFPSDLSVPQLVEAYRTHTPDVALAPGVEALLDATAARGQRQGVISDGPLASQRAKADALGLAQWCDPVVLTDEWGRESWKPNPRAYLAVEAAWGLSGAELVYVGDNPTKDFDAPNARGWRTVRLRLPEQVRHDLPDGDSPAQSTVRSVDELAAWLAEASA